jgi:hypothetical protein
LILKIFYINRASKREYFLKKVEKIRYSKKRGRTKKRKANESSFVLKRV